MLNVEKAFEVENGLAVCDADGNLLFYLTGTVGDPTGTPAPVPTIAIDQNNADMWKKFGPGDNDWELVGNGGSGDLCIGGVGANYIFTPEQCVGGGDANGD